MTFNDFTPSQQAAVTAAGDVCVVAGPGSGKTTVLVARLRRLIVDEQADPESIVAVTFTRKAAMSMRKRLAASAPDEAARKRLERAQVSTIHAFCARLLRENALEAGLDPQFQQLDEAEASIRLTRAVYDALDQLWRERPEDAALFLANYRETAAYSDDADETKIHKQLKDLVDSARARGERVHCVDLDRPEQPARRWITDAAARTLELYQQGKAEKALLDYTDLEQRTHALLAQSDLPVRIPYRYILLDEHQDTNPLQEKLVGALLERCQADDASLFAVGDVNQSIYLFRHAEPDVFRRFRDQVREKSGPQGVVELYDNFRSRPEILSAVAQLTGDMKGLEARELTPRRELPPKDVPSVEVQFVFARTGEAGSPHFEREARWVAKRILELREELTIGKQDEARSPRWSDFAVLIRGHDAIDLFARVFSAVGLPYELSGGKRFFEAQEVRDAISLLRALDDPADDVRLAAAMRSPFCGVNDETLLRIKSKDRRLFAGLLHPTPLGEEQRERLERFRALFLELRAERERTPPDVLLERLLSATGYRAWLREQEGGRRRIENVAKLGRLAARASAGGALSFSQMLDRVETMASEGSGGGEPEAAVPESADGVQLMTVHAAKGLEFPIVVMPSLQGGRERGSSSMLFHPDHGLGARWKPNPLDRSDKNPDAAYQAIHERAKARSGEEDERLFYVGMTRAEEHLVLSAAFRGKPRRGNWVTPVKNRLDPPWTPVARDPEVLEREGVRYRFAAYDRDPDFTAADLAVEKLAAPALLEPLPPGNQADSEAAVTSVALFADCPRRYYLSRYLGMEADSASLVALDDDSAPPVPPDELEPSELGRLVHDLLAGIPTAVEPPEGASALVERFRRSELGRRADAASDAEHERAVLFPLGGRLLRGQIDLLFSDDRGRVLLDYKTDRVSAAEAAERSKRYELQLQLYALALAAAGEKPDRAVLYFLVPDCEVDVDLSDPALEQARRTVAQLFTAQESGEFEVKPAERCRRCPHFETLCPAQIPPPPKKSPGQMSLFL